MRKCTMTFTGSRYISLALLFCIIYGIISKIIFTATASSVQKIYDSQISLPNVAGCFSPCPFIPSVQ